MLKKFLGIGLGLTLLLSSTPDLSFAAKKKKSSKPVGTLVNPLDLSQITVSYKKPGSSSKKKKTKVISCFQKIAGKASTKSTGTWFTSFSQESKSIKAKLKKSPGSASLKYALALNNALSKASKGQCKEPAQSSLAKYSGPWGEKQVRRLLAVFANGGDEALVQSYVQAGMDATVDDLLAWKPDSYVDGKREELSCDTNPNDNVKNCYPYMAGSDLNDFYLDGFISWINWRSIFTKNPARDVLFQFAMDERAPGDPRVLGGCNRYYFLDYIAKVDAFSSSGDYKKYVLDMSTDQFIHGKWLSGDSNHSGAPGLTGNEDYAREIMELTTLGTSDKYGQLNYTDLDVYITSLIFSGLDEVNNNGFCTIGYNPYLAAPGPHTVFGGTPYAITIGSSQNFSFPAVDFAKALMNVKADQMAWELARRMWPRFINSLGSPAAIQELADLIKGNDFMLWPVMKAMMTSKAFYAPESDRTIIKTPFTLFVTYARQIGMPVDNYNSLRDWLDDIGMLLGRPPTVFGFSYHLKELAADFYQEFRFKSLFYYTMWQDLEDIKDEYGWTPHNGLVAPVPVSGDAGVDLVNALVRRLGLADVITQAQLDQYVQFVNYYLGDCYSSTDPKCFMLNGQNKKLVWDPPDRSDADDDFYRLRLLAVMLGFSDAFAVM